MRPPLRNPWLGGAGAPAGARLRLFCFPYAGAGAHAFRTWKGALPPDVAVLPLHVPGRGSRLAEPAFTRNEDLAAALLDGLAGELTPPFAFFGHSMGALVAYEAARQLRDAGRPGPLRLFVAG